MWWYQLISVISELTNRKKIKHLIMWPSKIYCTHMSLLTNSEQKCNKYNIHIYRYIFKQKVPYIFYVNKMKITLIK